MRQTPPTNKKVLSAGQGKDLLGVLKARFEKNMHRHRGIEWANVEVRLKASASKMWSLNEMEKTGGEPDVVGHVKETDEYIFYDCSAETPKGRRNVCYDREGQKKRNKEGLRPAGNVLDMAAAMGIEPLTEAQYGELQKLGEFDARSQSWLKTPAAIANLGGAIFAHRRFNTVFVCPNTAPCFYSGRGFRGSLRV